MSKDTELNDLRRFLATFHERPILHVNGHEHPTALITVDFGQPKGGVSIPTDRGHELTSLLKAAARSVTRRKGNVRAHYDNQHGVFWASVSAG